MSFKSCDLRPAAVIVLGAFLGLASFVAPASAGLTFEVQSVSVTDGSANNVLDVTLTNSGPSAVAIGGFAFQITVVDELTFTAVDTYTTVAPYIFAGNSLFGPDDISNQPTGSPLPGKLLAAADIYVTGGLGISLQPGETVGLGRVHFDVKPGVPGPLTVTIAQYVVTNLSDWEGNDIPPTLGLPFSYVNGTVTILPVPEPASFVLAAFASGTAVLARRRYPLLLGR